MTRRWYILPLYARAQIFKSPNTSARGTPPVLAVDGRHSRISASCTACLSWLECSRWLSLGARRAAFPRQSRQQLLASHRRKVTRRTS
eukprot:COSAG01_NODE_1035_length_11997_cov_95.509665_12_plen_88_part_00